MPSRSPTRRAPPGTAAARPDRRDYGTLAGFRFLLRRFLGFSAAAARSAGLKPQQHQALLAIKGFPGDAEVTIHDLAAQLSIRHHSAVELVDRLVESGLVARRHDPADRRRVRLDLTVAAERRLADLSAAHLDELRRLRSALREIFDLLGETDDPYLECAGLVCRRAGLSDRAHAAYSRHEQSTTMSTPIREDEITGEMQFHPAPARDHLEGGRAGACSAAGVARRGGETWDHGEGGGGRRARGRRRGANPTVNRGGAGGTRRDGR